MVRNMTLYPDVPFPLEPSLLLLFRRGSESHGLFRPSTDPDSIDDRDLMGVCLPPVDYYFGVKQWTHAESIKGCWDVVLYEVRKFVGLLVKQNPNVIGALWLEPEDYLTVTPAGRLFLENRDVFRCRDDAYNSFLGYANSQLRKMTSGAFKGYMGDKRKKLVERFGYDTKNAAHLIRLLHMGKEYLSTGEMQVRRTWDRDMLLEIKSGGWLLERVKSYAEECFKACHAAHENSPLPETVDMERVNALLLEAFKLHPTTREAA